MVDDGRSRVAISISDRGAGISDEDLDKVFRPFAQANSGLRRSSGGTGLGMSIPATLAKRMGGTVWVESKMGAGTTFFVVLPGAVEQPE